jgi:plasmid stabilization system protein ParE
LIHITLTERTLRYTVAALNDLEALLLLAAKGWGVEQMTERHDRLFRVFDLIAANPEIGTIHHLRAEAFRRFFVDPHYIYYRVLPEEIEISRIVHQRQLQPK